MFSFRNSSSSASGVDGVMTMYGWSLERSNLVMYFRTLSSFRPNYQLSASMKAMTMARTGFAWPASHFFLSAATSRYPKGFRLRSRTLRYRVILSAIR